MQIEWSTALVADGVLTVELTDDAPEGFDERITAVLERLGRPGVETDERRLVVRDVEPGTEPDVRHLLDSAVLQAEADVSDDGDEKDDAEGTDDRDRAMTEAFRAFAET